MAKENKKKITGHCGICNSDIIIEWSEPEDWRFISGLERLMSDYIRDGNGDRCACSLVKIIKQEDNENDK